MHVNLREIDRFDERHIGPDERELEKMLRVVGAGSLQELADHVAPENIRIKEELQLPKAVDEYAFIKRFKKLVSQNKIFKSYIGLGYYNSITPPVIQRNIMENPGWYTAYTPYQAEISQGRLEALINFQQMVVDLTGLEMANASLLDEATAAAEAMSMFFSLRKAKKKVAAKFVVDKNALPQTIDTLRTRAEPLGIDLVVADVENIDYSDPQIFGIICQYPDSNGAVKDYTPLIAKAHEQDILVAVAADLMSLALLKSPGEMDADAAVGSTQRFGVPMGFGGPHAAYFATRENFKRQIPGRIIGVSVDRHGNRAYRMALQTREQHIRREKATSNICTAQVLLAVMAGMYAVYHGPDRLKKIASKIHGLTRLLSDVLAELGFQQDNKVYFDTLKIDAGSAANLEKIRNIALEKEINFRYFEDKYVGVSLDETTRIEDVKEILSVFENAAGRQADPNRLQTMSESIEIDYPAHLSRKSPFLAHPVFNSYHSEHEMLRYLKRLENKDLSLVHSMISLGSCTMKLNATTEMIPLSWDELTQLHPFAPHDQTKGYQVMLRQMEEWLNTITGMAATSFQPNSGAQGEFAGLMTIRAYQKSVGESRRNVALIPSSAHGTNPASAVMAGLEVAIVQCDANGNIDVEDLRAKTEKYKDSLSVLMITYPSTHGVFEEAIKEICQIVHDHGGQVYMDGANMNAQVGLTNPAMIGADVCHINLHKTFCIPHGGGGPGMGPISVKSHLQPFLPGHAVADVGGEQSISAVSAAPHGSASIIAISYAYIALMGIRGLKRATKVAILNANYIKKRLEGHYKVLYSGKGGWNAHELIVDCRDFKQAGVEVEDIAKRLMDYGFHAPTVSFPVPGTLMIEPTESESLEELDRFCAALIEIRKEIAEIESGKADRQNNLLKNAPHTVEIASADEWPYPYSRARATFPLPFVKENKFWPAVGRIDSAYGDRNLWCTCIPTEAYDQNVGEAAD